MSDITGDKTNKSKEIKLESICTLTRVRTCTAMCVQDNFHSPLKEQLRLLLQKSVRAGGTPQHFTQCVNIMHQLGKKSRFIYSCLFFVGRCFPQLWKESVAFSSENLKITVISLMTHSIPKNSWTVLILKWHFDGTSVCNNCGYNSICVSPERISIPIWAYFKGSILANIKLTKIQSFLYWTLMCFVSTFSVGFYSTTFSCIEEW